MGITKGPPDNGTQTASAPSGTPRFPDPIEEGSKGRAPNGEELD